MTRIILTEAPRVIVAHTGPIRLLARHQGQYVRPILAYAIDFRLEDNPAVPKQAMLQQASWIARHPLDELYIIYDRQQLVASRATPEQLRHWQADWRQQQLRQAPTHSRLVAGGQQRTFTLPKLQLLELPAGWWEWVEALDRDYNLVKAAKRPRPGEPTPEQVDELITPPAADLGDRLQRVFSAQVAM